MRLYFDRVRVNKGHGLVVETRAELDEALRDDPKLLEYVTRDDGTEDETVDFIPLTKTRVKTYARLLRNRETEYKEGTEFARPFKIPNLSLKQFLNRD